MKVLETIKTPRGTLTSPLSIAVVQHVTDYGPCDAQDIAPALCHMDGYTDDAELGALRRRLRDLCEGGHLHRVLIRDRMYWQAGPNPEDQERERERAFAVAPPRRINVMAGVYQPTPGPVLRAGADHRHIPSRGHRC